MFYFIVAVFIGVPILALFWFILNLFTFLKTPKDSEERKKAKSTLILSGVIAGVPIGIIVSIVVLFYLAILNM